jgi:hypothetical protein
MRNKRWLFDQQIPTYFQDMQLGKLQHAYMLFHT